MSGPLGGIFLTHTYIPRAFAVAGPIAGTIYLNIWAILNFQQTILGVSLKHPCLHSTGDDTPSALETHACV